MWWRWHNVISSLERTTSELREGIQQLERRIESDAQLQRLVAALGTAAQAAPAIGAAHDGLALAMRTPQKRGRTGGVAPALLAARLNERWPDGPYMSHKDWEKIERDIAGTLYMRRAGGGFARALNASRFPDGTFAPRDSD